jgi:subtilisin family serine protease
MARSPRLRYALATAALLASAFVTTASTPASAALPEGARPSDRVGADVVETLAETGEVDVVVMLDGHRPGSDVAALRRASAAAQDTTLAGFAEADLADLHRFETIPAFSATISDQAVLDRLAKRPGITRIDVDAPVETHYWRSPEEEGVVVADHVGASELHELGLTGEGSTVAVVDSGIDRNHVDLQGAVAHEACFAPIDNRYCPGGWFGRGSTFAEGPGTANDVWYHGTAASGVVASRGNLADLGMAPSARIVALKVGEVCPPARPGEPDPCPYMTSTVIRAGDYLAGRPDLGVDVLSMSFGLPIPYQGTYCDDADALTMSAKALIDNVRAAGTLAIASAGNDSAQDRLGMPGCLSNVVSTGATGLGPTGEVVDYYSNTGPGLDVLAPAWTMHPEPGGRTGTMRGTSSAAPVVAGCAAVLLQMGAQPTNEEVTAAIRSTGVPIDRDGATYRRLDCAAAARAIDPGLGTDPAVCVRSANPDHVTAGRATARFGYAFAVGSRDSLGRNTSGTVTSLRQDGPNTWTRVSSC